MSPGAYLCVVGVDLRELPACGAEGAADDPRVVQQLIAWATRQQIKTCRYRIRRRETLPNSWQYTLTFALRLLLAKRVVQAWVAEVGVARVLIPEKTRDMDAISGLHSTWAGHGEMCVHKLFLMCVDSLEPEARARALEAVAAQHLELLHRLVLLLREQ